MPTNIEFVQTSGVSFLEFSGPKPDLLTTLFDKMGMTNQASQSNPDITLHTQGDIRFISNPSHGGNAENFRKTHTRGASAIGLKVADSKQALELALSKGANIAELTDYDIPAICGVGTSLIYLVDESHEQTLLKQFGNSITEDNASPNKLLRIDHLTHNLNKGGVERMCQFYENIFGFKRVRSFHIEGKKTGLYSEVVASRCGKVIIPLNETKDDKSQIAEFIREYNGEGIQHIALLSADIFTSVENLRQSHIEFQDTPDTYYELLDQRLPEHPENTEKLHKSKILIDGGEAQGGGYLLQIFTKNSIGPIFFEYIQRKGNDGFGEGNFQALFESIELDQERRGVI